MSHLRDLDSTAGTEASKERILTRMAGVAGALPACVAARDRKGTAILLGRAKTTTELHAVAVILASWLAEAEAALAAGRRAA